MITREQTRPIRVGSLTIGGGAPVIVQSMTNTATADTEATLQQINSLAKAGCELVRVAVPDERAAAALPYLVAKSPLPLVADIHFNYRLALSAIDAGVAKIRINPGNIGGKDRLAAVVARAAEKKVAIRIGVNAGSLEKDIYHKYGGITAEALVESALGHIKMVEEMGFKNLIVSLKASSVPLTVAAHRLLAQKVNYPHHIGITEAGSPFSGTIHSAVGIGALLLAGLGDTIRVSLTAPPEEEVRVAKEILTAAGIRRFGPRVISCPTCGRTQIKLQELAQEIEERVKDLSEPLTIAVMGCAVNGPGEAREADLGVAGGKNEGLIFRRGKVLKKVSQNKIVDELMLVLDEMLQEKAKKH
ncbi:MAG: flavodoxin-dependent (E)-4-hydroxy-3-methylbut-2-enyl-diphosphate synthase [Firmicutes bacterium]|nr:flavodoxin-dependent (E)-4-hydroxy-3-methylbut-2-enyl-diphosphate synthase [Bacillota bacterium]